MKKVILIMIACTVIGVANAQYKPQAGKFNVEVGFAPFSEMTISSFGLKGRYFLKENMAIRLNLPFENYSRKNISYGGENNKVEQTSKISKFNFGIIPGLEYHVGSLEKLSPYFGAEVGILMNRSAEKTINPGFVEGNSIETKGPNGFGFHIAALAGVDWYITHGLYIGVEFGLAYDNVKVKSASVTTVTGGNSNTVNSNDYSKESDFRFASQALIRLGWTF